jgi:hypothetical protein
LLGRHSALPVTTCRIVTVSGGKNLSALDNFNIAAMSPRATISFSIIEGDVDPAPLAIGENLPIVPQQAPLSRAASACRFRDNDARFFLAPSKTRRIEQAYFLSFEPGFEFVERRVG